VSAAAVVAVAAAALVLGTATPARAFCGFFVSGADAALTNGASQVVLLREGSRTFLTMSNDYKGPLADFALVVPVPVILKPGDIKTLDPEVLRNLDKLTAPRLVEYWEQDPCRPTPDYDTGRVTTRTLESASRVAPAADREPDLGVRIEARFSSGEYQILILSAKESSGLETWLRRNGDKLPPGAATALAPYIREQMKFFVAKVDIKKVKRDARGTVVLSPLRMRYESSELRLPVRLGLLNAAGPQDLLIYVLHPDKRFVAANYPNLVIPSNLEVRDEVRADFGGFYGDLFDATVRAAGGRGVVTEYVWQSSSCDPCPVPPIAESDLLSLGAVAQEVAGRPRSQGPATGEPRVTLQEPPVQGIRVTYPDPGRSARTRTPTVIRPYLITRLHARYDKDTLTEDLIFKEAPGLIGGHADGGPVGSPAREQGAAYSSFQGRYVILHDWAGPVRCEAPRYGIWGGPPQADGKLPPLQSAIEPASVVRGRHDLARSIRTPVPSLGIAGSARPHPGRPR
jgi:hypothetical protein